MLILHECNIWGIDRFKSCHIVLYVKIKTEKDLKDLTEPQVYSKHEYMNYGFTVD